MPFKSKKQETYLKINEPKIYKEWKKRYGTFKSDTLDNKTHQSKYMADYSFTGKIKKYGFELSDGGKEYVITYGGRRIPSFRLPKDTYFHGVYTIERFVEELNQNQERAVSDVFNFLWNKTNNGHLDDILMNRAETFGAETKRYTDDEMAQAQYPNYFLQKKFGNNTDEELNPILYRHLFIGLSALDTETLDMLEDVVYNETEPNMGEKMKNTLDTVKEYRKLFYNIYGTYPPAYNSKNYYGAETFEYTVPDRINKTNEEKIIEMRKNDGLYNLYGTSDWEDGYESALYADQFGNVFEVRWFFDLSEFYDNKVGYNDDWNGNIEYDFNFSPKFPKGYVYWENMKTKEILAKAPFTHMEKIEQIGKAKPIPMNNSLLRRAETYGAEYTVEITGYIDGEPRRITGTEQELKDQLLDFHDPYDRMIDYRLEHIEDEEEAMRLLKEKWNKFTLKQICDNDDMLTLIETKEAPYAGLGSLFGFGQDTGLGSFTTSELTGSSAIHGDFDSASLNYSGHQAVFARAENEMKNVEFEDWAKQEMKTHGKDVSFKNWAKKEEKSHGNVELMDWAEHEEESHDERYGADMKTYEAYDDKISERQEYLIEKLGGNSNSDMTRSQASDLIKKLQGKRSGTWRAEEPMVEEPDFIPDGDGRALGQQTSSINLSPLHAEETDEEDEAPSLFDDWENLTEDERIQLLHDAGYPEVSEAESRFDKLSKEIAEEYEEKGKSPEEAERIGDATAAKIGRKKYGKRGMEKLAKKESEYITKTNMLIAGVVGIGLWKGKEILDMTMASLKRSAEEKRKGKACGSCNSQGSIRKPHTQVKNSEYSVDQVNPVEVQGQNDIHGAEGVTNPRHSPSSEPFGYPSKSLKMW